MANNKPFKLLPIKPYVPPPESPNRPAQKAKKKSTPQTDKSTGSRYSEAFEVPDDLLEPNVEANGLKMNVGGGSYAYQAPEALGVVKRSTINENIRRRAQAARAKIIFDPKTFSPWRRGEPELRSRLAELSRVAAGVPAPALAPLNFVPLPPPAPVKPPAPNTRKRRRNNNQNAEEENNTKRRNKSLKNRRHK